MILLLLLVLQLCSLAQHSFNLHLIPMKMYPNWWVLPESHVSSTRAFHQWPIFSNILSTLDVQARNICLQYQLGVRRYHNSSPKFLSMEVTNINSRTWICSFYTTISSLISPRLRLDCIKVQCMINCKKQKKGGLDCISLLKFLLSCCVVFLNALYLALYLPIFSHFPLKKIAFMLWKRSWHHLKLHM